MEHPAELARLLQDDAYDYGRATPAVAPGSFEESDALAAIDSAREEETAQLVETPAARARRRATYWRTHRARILTPLP